MNDLMDRSNEIEGLAELLADEHWTANRVDPAEIARSAGVTYNFGRYRDYFDGYLECRLNRFHIYINLDSNRGSDSPRARFSFAHELGHYFIDWHRCALERGVPPHASQAEFQSNEAVEREADLFAANLLMPKEMVRRKLPGRAGATEIQELADSFGTSLSAMAIRCARVGTASLIVMRWSSAGRAWCWSSEKFARLTGNKTYRALDRIPPDSLTRQTIENAQKGDPTIRQRGTTLATWFPGIWAGSSIDEILIEECISLGQYGALTILRPA